MHQGSRVEMPVVSKAFTVVSDDGHRISGTFVREPHLNPHDP
jgi:hypothetical protein